MASALLVTFLSNVEGVRTKVYKDSAGYPTVGVGRLLPKGSFLKVGQSVPFAHVMEWLDEDADEALETVDRLVSVPLNYHERAAVASWVFNLGEDKVRGSKTLALLNGGDKQGFANALLSWNKQTVNGKLEPVDGLTKRREKERALFLTGDWPRG